MECNVPDKISHALPENINSSSGSRSSSDVQDMSDEVGSLPNSDWGEDDDIDISFSSLGEPVSPDASQNKLYVYNNTAIYHPTLHDVDALSTTSHTREAGQVSLSSSLPQQLRPQSFPLHRVPSSPHVAVIPPGTPTITAAHIFPTCGCLFSWVPPQFSTVTPPHLWPLAPKFSPVAPHV